MDIREMIEERENKVLSPYAVHACDTKGRAVYEEPSDVRTEFQRDRDRIIHSKSFRRLKHKTQVFLAPEGDHYRERLTHTLEVAQISKTIAKALALNEDLVEAIALGHDLGHTPFGHAGERALNDIYKTFGQRFKHSEQSLRVVDKLEKDGEGLNLTWEVRDGILNHGSGDTPATLEGQVVRFSDKIAYISHDIDDAIRAGVLKDTDVPKAYRDVLGDNVHDRLDNIIHNVIYNSMNCDKIQMSEEFRECVVGIRQFMFEHVYVNPTVKGQEKKAENMIKMLYEYYYDNIGLLPREYIEVGWRDSAPQGVIVGDYIAGMTDYYATNKFEELFIPAGWSK